MSSTPDRRKRQWPRLLRLPSPTFALTHFPHLHLALVELAPPTPLQLLQPPLVRNPVALPIERPRIYQHAHASLQQAGDVELAAWRTPLVEVGGKGGADGGGTGGKVERGGRGEGEQGAERGRVEVVGDHLRRWVAEGTEARFGYVVYISAAFLHCT